MPTLIDRDGRLIDRWIRAGATPAATPAGASVIVPLAAWREAAPAWRDRARNVGVLLSPADDPQLIADDLPTLSLVAVEFPAFTDGRGYSIARLLRGRYDWRGELRAVGDLLRDQLFYLARVGFDTFELRDGVDADAAISAFRDFSERYQAAADTGPLFERRFGPTRPDASIGPSL